MENPEIQQLTPQVQVQQPEEQEIDLLEVFYVLWHKAWVLVLALIVGMVITGAATIFLITPQYESTSIIYILSKTTSITSLADLQIGSNLATDFQIIATTREVVQVVLDDLGIDTPYEEFVKTIEVTNPTNSHMIQVTVTNPDPGLAAHVANALAEQMKLQIADVMSTDQPSTVQRAVVPEKPSSPNLMVNCLVGGLVFFAIAAGIILMRHFMDDTIKNEDDVDRYLNLNTLAAIPIERNGSSGGRKGHSKKKQQLAKSA